MDRAPAYFLLGAALLGFAGFAFVELVVSYPVPWWLYAGLLPLFALGFLRPVAWRAQLGALVQLSMASIAIAALHFIPWSSRKSFIRSLDRIPPRASESEARAIMRNYHVLTFVNGPSEPPPPAPSPYDTPMGPPSVCDVTPGDAGVVQSEDVPPDHRELHYRHSCDGEFNADFGIVELAGGKVTAVRFQPD